MEEKKSCDERRKERRGGRIGQEGRKGVGGMKMGGEKQGMVNR